MKYERMENDVERYQRNITDVQSVIKHAKLEDSDLKPLTQTIYFADNFEDFKLLELQPSLVAALTEGQRVVFRGLKDDNAVLCTHDKTFEVKEAETSNSLLLIPNLLYPQQVQTRHNVEDNRILQEQEILGVYHEYLELRQMKPKLNKLRSLLKESSYCGSELEESLKESGIKFYDTDSLLDIVQASEEELQQGLEEIGAFVLDGHWRVLKFEYHFRVASYFLNLLDENSWSVCEVPYKETEELLKDLMPLPILKHIFNQYTEMTGEMDDDGEPVYKLKEVKVCRFLAETLLRSTGKFVLQDFLQTWQGSVPEGIQTDLQQLEGLALLDLEVRPHVIFYFPETDLPEDIVSRMHTLFRVREKWSLDEIRPYIEKLTTEKLNVNALLTKHARASNVNGVRFYSARHGK